MSELVASTTAHVTTEHFRHLMAGFPTGVAVVTGVDGHGAPRGMTCSSVCGVSIEPPTLLVCLRAESPTLAAVLTRSRFAVNLLNAEGLATSKLFASGAADRFDRVTWRPGPTSGNPHLVEDAHTIADCRVSHHHDVGDHTVLFGEVCRVTRNSRPSPLLYGLRTYRTWPSGSDTPSAG